MAISFRLKVCAALWLVGLTGSWLQAGEVTNVNWFSGVASVAATIFPAPAPFPANDNVVGTSGNVLFVTQKNYIGIGPVDLVFDIIDNGGVTEYLVREGVSNGTGLAWSGYHIELGFGTGTGFIKSTTGDGLDFDAPDFDSLVDFNPAPGIFPSATVTEDDIFAGGGLLPNGGFAGYFRFHLDIPDGITEFTLRQSPVPLTLSLGGVPEPSCLLLISGGLAGLSAIRRRNRPSEAASA